jgi:hypothetical protein
MPCSRRRGDAVAQGKGDSRALKAGPSRHRRAAFSLRFPMREWGDNMAKPSEPNSLELRVAFHDRRLPALLEPTRPRVREKSLKNFPQSPRRVTFESEQRDFFGRRFMVLRDWMLQNSNSERAIVIKERFQQRWEQAIFIAPALLSGRLQPVCLAACQHIWLKLHAPGGPRVLASAGPDLVSNCIARLPAIEPKG